MTPHKKNFSLARWWQMIRKLRASGLHQLAVNTMLLVLVVLLLVVVPTFL